MGGAKMMEPFPNNIIAQALHNIQQAVNNVERKVIQKLHDPYRTGNHIQAPPQAVLTTFCPGQNGYDSRLNQATDPHLVGHHYR
jgi:hypothetical protein